MYGYNIWIGVFKRHLLQISQSPLVAAAITLPITNEAPVVKDSVLHFHLLAIEACHYLIAYKAWRSHLHQNINIYSGPCSIPKIKRWNHYTDPIQMNLE